MSTKSEVPSVLQDTLDWFKEAMPNPDIKNFNVQVGCHLEEVVEMITELHTDNDIGKHHLARAIVYLNALAEYMKRNHHFVIKMGKRHDFADAVVDQTVTAAGINYILDVDHIGALNEVNRGNYSKFVDGKAVFDENGKIKKGPNFVKADLTPYI